MSQNFGEGPNDNPALDPAVAWNQTVDKLISEPTMPSLLTLIYVTIQWSVKVTCGAIYTGIVCDNFDSRTKSKTFKTFGLTLVCGFAISLSFRSHGQ